MLGFLSQTQTAVQFFSILFLCLIFVGLSDRFIGSLRLLESKHSIPLINSTSSGLDVNSTSPGSENNIRFPASEAKLTSIKTDTNSTRKTSETNLTFVTPEKTLTHSTSKTNLTTATNDTNLISVPSKEKRIPPTERKKVVVCISGKSRTFYHPTVHESFLKEIVNPLRMDYDTDVIFNMELETNSTEWKPVNVITKDLLRDAMAKFSPIHIHELQKNESLSAMKFEDITMNFTNGLVERPSKCTNTSFVDVRVPNSLHRHAQCRTHIRQQEKKYRKKYDFVYVLRPDLMFVEGIVMPNDIKKGMVYTQKAPATSTDGLNVWWEKNFPAEVEAGETFQSCSDQVFAARRNEAEIVMQAINTMLSCDFYNVYGMRNPEVQLSYWALTHGLKLNATSWYFGIVRFYIGMECHHFQDQKRILRNGSTVESVWACIDYNIEHLHSRI